MAETAVRSRKPKARHHSVIIGGLEENARMLRNSADSESIGIRISELLDELSRSIANLNGKGEAEE